MSHPKEQVWRDIATWPYSSQHLDTNKRTAINTEDNNYGMYSPNNEARASRYSWKLLFMSGLAMFSCFPTTVLLVWIISWGIVILYVCTLGFAVSIASVIGLSMIAYGPTLCLCAVAASSLATLYGLSTKAWDLYKVIQTATSHLAYRMVPTLVRTKFDMLPGQIKDDPGAGTGWPTLPQSKDSNNNPQPGNWGTNNWMY